jgi:hypothetical protein
VLPPRQETHIIVDPNAAPGSSVVVVPYPAPPAQPYLPYDPAQPYPPGYAVPYPAQPYPPGYAVPYPAQPYPPYAAPPEPPPDPAHPRGFSFKAWAGPAYRRIYDVPITGADFGMAFGAQKGFYGELGFMLGRTNENLFVWQLRPQATGELRLGRVHLGLGLGFTVIGVTRATTGSSIAGAGLASTAFATVDLITDGLHAMYLGGKMTFDWLPGGRDDSDAFLWGPSAVLGWRY